MTFLQLDNRPQRVVPASGPANARIAIVGEAPGAFEEQTLKPFVGPAGSVLEQCLHSAGLIRSECYVTNVVKVKPAKNDISPFYNATKGTFSVAGQEWVERLRSELDAHPCNVIVACGATALSALTGQKAIMKYRGYVLPSIGLKEMRKVIPCIHPAASLRGQYIYRHLISADLKKAKELSFERELKRPERQLVYDFGRVEEALEWLEYFEHQPIVCFDIEVLNWEIACISFASQPGIAASIPLASTWSERDELLLWRGIQRVLGNPHSVKVGQNILSFDNSFLLTKCGIEVRGPIHDTMIAHSIVYPELPKGLAFLGSIYCGSQAFWKDLVKFGSIKEND